MATKPEKTEWTPSAGDRQTPTGSKKNTGWIEDERPPYQFFNWSWWVDTQWQNFLAPAVRHNVIISDNVEERDFASLAAYIAGAPVAGDRILITNNQVIAAQIIIPSNITLCIQDGVKFTSAIDLADSLIEFGDNVIIEGVLVLELSHAGTVDAGIELNGDGNNLDIVINNTGAGTLTVGVLVNVAKIANLLGGEVKNTGAGAVTTVLNDLSLDESNIVEIRDSINNIVDRSLGAISFLTGFTMDLGSDANGDIYYRDTGILKRLAKGADGEILELVSGIPSWEAAPVLSPRDIFKNLLSLNNSGTPNSQLDISFDEGFLQNDTGDALRVGSFSETVDITNTITAVLNGLEETQTLTGTYSTVGTAVTGVGTLFTTEYQVGDVLWSDTKVEGRVITNIAGDLAMTVGSAFSTDVAAGETAKRGGEAADAFYHKWIISSTTATRIMLSTRSFKGLAPVLLGGFTFKGYVGFVRNDASSDFRKILQRDNNVVGESIQVVTNGSATVLTAVDCSSVVANTVRVIKGIAQEVASTGWHEFATVENAIALGMNFSSVGSDGDGNFRVIRNSNDVTPEIHYRKSIGGAGNVDSWITGWEF